MFKVLKVTGESLSPLFREGDFVVLGKIPFILNSIKEGDVLVFHHPTYGTLIKLVDRVEEDRQAFFVSGLHENSLDSRQLGSIPAQFLVGKVIWHIRVPQRNRFSRDKDTQTPIPPGFVLVFAILAVSTASIFIKFALASGAPALVVAAFRLTIATLVLAPFALSRHRAELKSLTRHELGLALLSGIFLAIHFATWISSLSVASVASSVVLVSTTPLWVAMLSPFTVKEPVSRIVTIGMLLALIGGSVVGISDSCSIDHGRLVCPGLIEFMQGKAFLADVLALLGAIMAAGYLIIGRKLRARISLISYIFVVYGMAAIVLVIIMLSNGLSPFGYPPLTYLWFILLALIPQLLGHSTFNWALRYLSTAYVSIALLGEPIGSTILAYIFLQETPGILKVFGAILILAGIYLASRSEK